MFIGIVAKAQTTLMHAIDLLQQKNYVAALDICNRLLEKSNGALSALGVRSQIYTAMGKYDLAIQDADKALSIDHTFATGHYAKAEALFYGNKDYRQALQHYNAAIRLNAQMSEAYCGKARVLMAKQNYKEAMILIEDAIQKSFNNEPDLHYVRGLLNYQRGKYKLAIDDYDWVLVISANWNSYQVFLNRGIAYHAFGKPDFALQDLTKAITIDPNNIGGYIARGNVLYQIAEYREAIEDFKKAEVLNPENSVNTYNIGMSYFKLGDKTSACKYFQKSCLQDNKNACKMLIMNCSSR
jgi:tetratricopeptide (TPR) repeat protein